MKFCLVWIRMVQTCSPLVCKHDPYEISTRWDMYYSFAFTFVVFLDQRILLVTYLHVNKSTVFFSTFKRCCHDTVSAYLVPPAGDMGCRKEVSHV
jgi:hypothetical protein